HCSDAASPRGVDARECPWASVSAKEHQRFCGATFCSSAANGFASHVSVWSPETPPSPDGERGPSRHRLSNCRLPDFTIATGVQTHQRPDWYFVFPERRKTSCTCSVISAKLDVAGNEIVMGRSKPATIRTAGLPSLRSSWRNCARWSRRRQARLPN